MNTIQPTSIILIKNFLNDDKQAAACRLQRLSKVTKFPAKLLHCCDSCNKIGLSGCKGCLKRQSVYVRLKKISLFWEKVTPEKDRFIGNYCCLTKTLVLIRYHLQRYLRIIMNFYFFPAFIAKQSAGTILLCHLMRFF